MKKAMSLILVFTMLFSIATQFTLTTEAAEKVAEFDIENLRFDDHVDLTGNTVEIIDAGRPTSYQVGYGVDENTVLDKAVVTLKGSTLIATGIGTATVKIDGEVHEITVTAAPISLLLLAGQSNMRGSEGNANQSIVCPDGMVYATFGDDRGDADGIMNVNNATNFAASALTGEYSTVNVNGTTDNLSYYPINSLTEDGKGTFGPDSGFAYEWVKQTGEKVWIVNAAHGGSSITSWQPNATNFKEAVLLFGACQETLRKEIAAGHYTLSHMGYFWCQGCSDYNWTAEKYVTNYLAMHNGLKSSLAFDHDSNVMTDSVIFEFAGIIPVRAGHDYNDGYREDIYTDTTTYKFYESFMDLQMTGPRVAQYWMCNNPELEDIWMVCNIGENWVWMPDGANGVTDYFQAHYENGTVDYITQVSQKASWYTPTTPAAVHDSIHYNQIGYNEVGRESARNALIMLGEIEAPKVETTVELLTWDGYTAANKISASLIGDSETLVVPKIYPVWKSKEVTYTLTTGFAWSYYDILATDESLTGRLTMVDQIVTIEGHNWSEWETLYEASADGPGRQERTCSHCNKVENRNVDGVWQTYKLAEHLLELPEHVCCNTNLWTALPHEEVHFTSGKTWGKTSTRVTSITIPVNPGDKLYATSWKKAVENGHATSNGIRVTFFDAKGIAKTMGPGQTDREFYKNGEYLVAPEGSIAINIAMWYDSEDYEVYILNRDHVYENHICKGCGQRATGFIKDSDGSRYYYADGSFATGWTTIDGKTYYFNTQGILFEGKTKISGILTYYFDTDHALLEGMLEEDGGVRFYKGGIRQYGWADTDGDGKNDTYFFVSSQLRCEEDRVLFDGVDARRFFKYNSETGFMEVVNGFYTNEKGTQFFKNGIGQYGWITADGVSITDKPGITLSDVHYFAYGDGLNFYMVEDAVKTIGGVVREFDENHLAKAYTGWATNKTTGNANYYIKGVLQQGWCETPDGWVYLSRSENLANNITYGDVFYGWRKIGGKVYYFRAGTSTPAFTLITDEARTLTYEGIRKVYYINQPADSETATGADYYITNPPAGL